MGRKLSPKILLRNPIIFNLDTISLEFLDFFCDSEVVSAKRSVIIHHLVTWVFLCIVIPR